MMHDQRFLCEAQILPATALGEAETQLRLAAARKQGHPVLCACRSPGIPMVLRRYNGTILIARWPDTGERHATDCPSYDPSSNPEAIREHPDGTIEIRTSFQLTPPVRGGTQVRSPGRPTATPVAPHNHLDLSGVLHELWRRAGFDKWFPAMQGKRNWGVVRYHLAETASVVQIGQHMLCDVLFSALPFHRGAPEALDDQIARLQQMIGEKGIAVLLTPVKLIDAAKFGYRIEFYHLPKLAFYAASSYGVADKLRQLPEGHRLIGMALVDARGKHFRVHGLGTIPVTPHWLPYDRLDDGSAIESLAATDLRFLVRHGHLRSGHEIAIELGGDHDGRLIFPDPNGSTGFRL